jgi:radical SAM protein with 4Fe4S-binding SPASM domain
VLVGLVVTAENMDRGRRRGGDVVLSLLRETVVRYADRLLGRYAWYARLRRRATLVTLLRPARPHWSGLTLQCTRQGEADGALCVSVWRLSWGRPVRVRTSFLPLAAVADVHSCNVYWDPIEDAAASRVLVTVRQLDPSGRGLVAPPFAFSWTGDNVSPIFSPPEPDVPFPSAVLFSPVTSCNLNCIHCISRHSRDRVSVFDDEAWASLAAAAATGRLTHLRTDYSGDLLFSDRRHGDWLERVIGLSIPFAVTTHANDLSPAYTSRLLQSRLFSITFSLDSLDPEDYLRIRRGARPLAEVVDNIRHFMVARNAQRPDVETLLTFVLMRRNLDSIGPAIDLAAELGVSAIVAGHLHAYTNDMAEESLLLEPERYARAYHELIARASAKGVYLGLPLPFPTRPLRRGHVPCAYPWSTAVLLGNGDVMGCCVPGTTVGNLRDTSLEQVWNGTAMREFRRRVNSDTPPEPCTVCPMRRLENNYASYVPGLPEVERQRFERRCLDAARQGA